ncbi:hypothetical protein GMOD_00007568 [Pyrenophora seminiperda CCB06]|uniref:NADH dehydrogenase [ubiquinone] 1 beta subcomplex subunit 11, mitochondrial n=1 Tax=Pyrenophora seminiperda CCB06 TaxID=1302712 RepID=A0A3M7MDI9_9PLEO|nr:hypothetical protein GMOD_00007568 [Pyrenophora seminiperda CCB06]
MFSSGTRSGGLITLASRRPPRAKNNLSQLRTSIAIVDITHIPTLRPLSLPGKIKERPLKPIKSREKTPAGSASRTAVLRPATATQQQSRPAIAAHHRAFSTSQVKRIQYDPPTGWLFGVKPGEQYEKEGWEGPMFWGFGGACLFGVVAYAFKPDTSIQTWALEEARRRLEKEGILQDPDTVKKE